jgi:hydrogenase nickel incorporation protein HypA/HybF
VGKVLHEWALAEGVLLTVLRVAAERGARRVVRVRLRLGELQQVDEPILSTALRELSKGGPAAQAEFELIREPAGLECNRCGHAWRLSPGELGPARAELVHFIPEAAHAYLKCPACGSPDFAIKTGRGVWIESVEVE